MTSLRTFGLNVLIAFLHATANTFTLLIVGLTVALLVFGKKGDALFLASTITANALIAIIQEVRAKQALRKLELVHASTATILRGNKTYKISSDELAVGMHVALEAGDQILADGHLLSAEHLSVNQALLTGEAHEVTLKAKDLVFAGSFVVAGSAVARVTAIGPHTRAGQMSNKLSWYQQKLTPLQKSLSRILQYLTYLAIALGVLVFIDGQRSNIEFTTTLSTITSGAISVVPEGLLLASTLLYSYGALSMVKKRVLVQRIAAVESFSRLNTLCLDKTGTLTSSTLTLQTLRPLSGYSDQAVRTLLSCFTAGKTSNNSTALALEAAFPPARSLIKDILPFSSSRKFSAVRLTISNKHRTLVVGAPDVLAAYKHLKPEEKSYIRSQARQGYRVLLTLELPSFKGELETINEAEATPIALIILKPELRPDAIDTIFYLQAQGVAVKVISGDSLETVQAIAKEVGILHWRKGLTGDQLAALTPKQWKERVPVTTIFARVLPEQKEAIIKTLQEHGFVGMVGDGVNDALALKTADLSIAMAEGSKAARQVADVVLLDNSFASLPIGMRLGAQIVLGVEMVANLFFNKIVMGTAILLLTLALSIPYPFSTRHLLLLNIFIIGIPTMLWSLFPAQASTRRPAERMSQRVMRFTLPNGIITALAVLIGYRSVHYLPLGLSQEYYASTAAFLITLFIGIVTVWLIPRASKAVQNYNAQWWPWAYAGISIAIVIAAAQIDAASELFTLTQLSWLAWGYIICITGLASLVLWRLVYEEKRYVLR